MARTKKKRMTRIAFILFCCTIPVINWLIFYVYANLSSFTMAFTNKDGVLSFDNFVRFWEELNNQNSDIRIAIRNTFLTFALMFVTFPFKVLVSYFLYKKVPGASVYRIPAEHYIQCSIEYGIREDYQCQWPDCAVGTAGYAPG